MKSIGKGSSTRVWQDKWIFDEVPRHPIYKQLQINYNLKVAELFDQYGHWNLELLMELFSENEVKRILTLSVGGTEDKFICSHTIHGSYTVKSGYWLIANKEANRRLDSSILEQQRRALMKRVWKAATLPKIKMFLWRALYGAIAVADHLNSRGLQVPPTCQLCKADPENINHVLFLCDVALNLWMIYDIPIPTTGFSVSLEENFEYMFNMLDKVLTATSRVKVIPWMLWSI